MNTLASNERGVVVRGKLHGRHIELDERVDELDGEVEVFVRSVGATPRPTELRARHGYKSPDVLVSVALR